MRKLIAIFLSVMITMLSFPSFVLAADDSTEWNEIVDAFNKETDEVYTPYFEIVDELNTAEDPTDSYLQFVQSLQNWDQVFTYTSVVYSRYVDSSDSEKAEVANLGLESATLAQESLALYTRAISAEDEATAGNLFEEADTKFYDAVNKHDVAVDLYNDYSGVNSSFGMRNFLIGATVVLAAISGVLFLMSRTGSQLESAIVKSMVYKNLLSGTLGMTVGLGITAATYAWAVENGGSYFIFYGPVLAGFANLIKQIGWFLKDGRKQLKEIKAKESSGPVPGIYMEPAAPVKVQ